MLSRTSIDGSLMTAILLLFLQILLPSLWGMIEQRSVESMTFVVIFAVLIADVTAGFIFAAEEKNTARQKTKSAVVSRGLLGLLAVVHALVIVGAGIAVSTKSSLGNINVPVLVSLVTVGCLLLVNGHRKIASMLMWQPSRAAHRVAEVLASISTLFFSSIFLSFLSDPTAGPALIQDVVWIVLFCLFVFVPLEEPRLRARFFSSSRSSFFSLLVTMLLAACSAAIAFYVI